MSEPRRNSVTSADGTQIAYHSVGSGDGVIVVGGVLRSGDDYFRLARGLAENFEVHVVDRRGRGSSGPQGPGYSIEKEREDIEAVLRRTGAHRIFGHSYGGLAVLEMAKRTPGLAGVAVYEPGVSVDGSIPTGWIPRYEQLLAAGDKRGAFACLVRGSGHAPRLLELMPLGCVKAVLRMAIRPPQWRRIEPLLEANLTEHEEVARLDGSVSEYEAIAAPVLLLGGAKSPPASLHALRVLDGVLTTSTVDLMPGLTHNAPDEKAPRQVAERVVRFFTGGGTAVAGVASSVTH